VIADSKSWFFLNDPSDAVEAETRFGPPKMPKEQFDIKKDLISIVYSANGVSNFLDLSTDITYNRALFCEQVLFNLIDDIASHGARKILK
jgi:hypothetical protein